MTTGPQAKVIELEYSTGNPRRYTVADGTAISKGILLVLSDPRTAAGTSTATGWNSPCAGISAMDKEANDGSTSITAWTRGIFDLRASGAINIGSPVVMAGSNEVKVTDVGSSGAIVIGYALETASDQEVINVRLNL